MLSVRITVVVGTKIVPLEQVTDPRVSTALRSAGQDVARRLEGIKCPEHHKTASNVRLHFDKSGNADLKYDSCCAQLGKRIGKELG